MDLRASALDYRLSDSPFTLELEAEKAYLPPTTFDLRLYVSMNPQALNNPES